MANRHGVVSLPGERLVIGTKRSGTLVPTCYFCGSSRLQRVALLDGPGLKAVRCAKCGRFGTLHEDLDASEKP